MTERTKGVLAMVVLAFVFASMGIFARYLQFDFTILQQVYLRVALAFALGALVFVPFTAWSKFLRLSSTDWWVLVFRGLCMYGGVTLFSLAIISTTYSNVSFITALPLLPLFGYAFFRDKITPEIVAYILLGFLGVILISVKDFSNIFSFGVGELYALASLILFDFSYIGRKWQSNALSNREIAVAMFLVGALAVFVLSLVLGEGLPTINVFSWYTVAVLVVAALFNIANLVLVNYGFERLSSTLAGTILTLEVVFAVCIGMLLYAEFPTLQEWAGNILVLIAVYKMNQIS